MGFGGRKNQLRGGSEAWETNEQSRDFGVGVCTAGKGGDCVWEHFVRFGDLEAEEGREASKFLRFVT